MNPSDKPPGEREITYQIGWKKGKIAGPLEKKAATSSMPPAQVQQGHALARKWIWKEVSLFPAYFPFFWIWIWLLPAAGFAAFIWLAYTLAH